MTPSTPLNARACAFIFTDEKNHASMIEGARCSKARGPMSPVPTLSHWVAFQPDSMFLRSSRYSYRLMSLRRNFPFGSFKASRALAPHADANRLTGCGLGSSPPPALIYGWKQYSSSKRSRGPLRSRPQSFPNSCHQRSERPLTRYSQEQFFNACARQCLKRVISLIIAVYLCLRGILKVHCENQERDYAKGHHSTVGLVDLVVDIPTPQLIIPRRVSGNGTWRLPGAAC